MSDAMQALFFALVFINGVLIGYAFGGSGNRAKAPESKPISEAEAEKIRKEREELEAQQKAFKDMMGYNADIAYGVNEDPFGGSS